MALSLRSARAPITIATSRSSPPRSTRARQVGADPVLVEERQQVGGMAQRLAVEGHQHVAQQEAGPRARGCRAGPS